MADTLHILRNTDDTKALECIEAQAKECDITLLFIQESATAAPSAHLQYYTLEDDTDDSISYDRFVRLVFEHESVVVW